MDRVVVSLRFDKSMATFAFLEDESQELQFAKHDLQGITKTAALREA